MQRREVLAAGIALAGVAACGAASQAREAFACPPCGCSMDDRQFSEPGTCPACDMTLMPVHETVSGEAPRTLPPGAGRFRLVGGRGHEHAAIHVHYYRPANFVADAPVLLVLPGSGRDAAEYRNVWLEVARREGMLIASLEYPEADYDFAAYHMGGLIENLELRNVSPRKAGRGRVLEVDDDNIVFTANPAPERWLFSDFDRVFAHLQQATGSTASSYDLFGHSAGAQIAHRFVLCRARSKARRVIAANAGFYTLPSLEEPLPTGLGGTGLTSADLQDSLAKELIVLLGTEDDHDGAGGTLLHSPQIDRQGLHRLSRGMHFFSTAEAAAKSEGVTLAWRVALAEGIGHDFRAMSWAAAEHLKR